MPSANGVYSLPAGYLAVTGATIQASQHNPPLEDIASALTGRLSRDGTAAMTGALQLAVGAVTLPGIVFSTDLTTGLYKTTAGFGVAVSGAKVAEFGASGLLSGITTASLADQVVTLPKLFDPGAASVLLGTSANASQAVTATGNNGSGLIRLTVASSAAYTTGQKKIVANVGGTTEANGRWTITVVDATHIDLQGSTFVNAFTTGGTIGGGVDVITLGAGLSMAGNVLSASLNPTLVPNYLSGLTLSVSGVSSTMAIAAGGANDSTNTTLMKLGTAIGKNTASWGVGTNNGGLDTGSIATSTWYDFYLIERTDTGAVDVIFSTSTTGPAMPANYTLWRYIGSGKTDGSANWTRFYQVGDEFIWDVPVLDQNLSSTPNGLYALTVPPGHSVSARMHMNMRSTTAGGNVLVHSPLTTNQTSASGNLTSTAQVSGIDNYSQITIMTDTSRQIRALGNGVGATTWTLATISYINTRGK